jgi:hypothetical protein
MFVGSREKLEELGKVPCLAIAKAKGDRGICLHFCESDWSPIAVAGKFDSVAAAERRAERMYPGSSALWLDAPFTEEDVRPSLSAKRRDCDPPLLSTDQLMNTRSSIRVYSSAFICVHLRRGVPAPKIPVRSNEEELAADERK